MSAAESIKPGGEKIRQAIRWISDNIKAHPEKTRRKILHEAEIRFDLSPLECEFINSKLDKETA